jgi:hypothetical protein
MRRTVTSIQPFSDAHRRSYSRISRDDLRVARVNVDEVGDILEGLRRLPELDEVKPAVFYVKRKPFLHFHESATIRGVDVRDGKDWGERIELPIGPISKTTSSKFLREVKRRLQTTLAA